MQQKQDFQSIRPLVSALQTMVHLSTNFDRNWFCGLGVPEANFWDWNFLLHTQTHTSLRFDSYPKGGGILGHLKYHTKLDTHVSNFNHT